MKQREAPSLAALIVEDEAILALAISDVLAGEGFRTILAHTAAEARTADDLTVAVVNLRLGGEIAGQHVIRSLRRRMPNLPVVVVTGYHEQAPEADLRGLGWPTVRLQKPVSYPILVSTVWEVISRTQQGAEAPGGRRRAERHRHVEVG